MSRIEGDKAHLLNRESLKRPRLMARTLEVEMQRGSLPDQIRDRNLNEVDERIAENFQVEDRREKVTLKMIKIPNGFTANSLWTLLSQYPEYANEWELAGSEHLVALYASPILKSKIKDRSLIVLATRSSISIDEKLRVPSLTRFVGVHRLIFEDADTESAGSGSEGDLYLLLVRKS